MKTCTIAESDLPEGVEVAIQDADGERFVLLARGLPIGRRLELIRRYGVLAGDSPPVRQVVGGQ